ncbi:MAG: hypothetical protein HZA51_16830 [Planctomycetes bacterium]|nr:hypothetical protein [Planctomycetota bacterium]
MANRIKVRVGDSEIELEGDAKFIESQLTKFYQKIGTQQPNDSLRTSIATDSVQSRVKAATPTKEMSPAEFLRRVAPRGGTEQLLALAHFLEQNRDAKDFSQQEVRTLCGEAKLKNLHGQYFVLAVQQGLLRSTAKSRYALTLTGEDAVSKMIARSQGD